GGVKGWGVAPGQTRRSGGVYGAQGTRAVGEKPAAVGKESIIAADKQKGKPVGVRCSSCARSRRRDEPTPGPNQAEVLIIGEPLSRDLVAGPGVGKNPVRPCRKMESLIKLACITTPGPTMFSARRGVHRSVSGTPSP